MSKMCPECRQEITHLVVKYTRRNYITYINREDEDGIDYYNETEYDRDSDDNDDSDDFIRNCPLCGDEVEDCYDDLFDFDEDDLDEDDLTERKKQQRKKFLQEKRKAKKIANTITLNSYLNNFKK